MQIFEQKIAEEETFMEQRLGDKINWSQYGPEVIDSHLEELRKEV